MLGIDKSLMWPALTLGCPPCDNSTPSPSPTCTPGHHGSFGAVHCMPPAPKPGTGGTGLGTVAGMPHHRVFSLPRPFQAQNRVRAILACAPWQVCLSLPHQSRHMRGTPPVPPTPTARRVSQHKRDEQVSANRTPPGSHYLCPRGRPQGVHTWDAVQEGGYGKCLRNPSHVRRDACTYVPSTKGGGICGTSHGWGYTLPVGIILQLAAMVLP